MMDFFPGQRVVCISKTPWQDNEVCRQFAWPVVGQVYTVRDVELTLVPGGYTPCIRLVEIINPLYHWRGTGVAELVFHSERFRPVEFTAMGLLRELGAPVVTYVRDPIVTVTVKVTP